MNRAKPKPAEQGADSHNDDSHVGLQWSAGVEYKRRQDRIQNRKGYQRHKPKAPFAIAESLARWLCKPGVYASAKAWSPRSIVVHRCVVLHVFIRLSIV